MAYRSSRLPSRFPIGHQAGDRRAARRRGSGARSTAGISNSPTGRCWRCPRARRRAPSPASAPRASFLSSGQRLSGMVAPARPRLLGGAAIRRRAPDRRGGSSRCGRQSRGSPCTSAEERPLILLGVVGVIGDQPAADLGAVRPAHHHRVAAPEAALDLDHAGRQQALARAQRAHRAGVDHQRAARLRASRRSISCAPSPDWPASGTRCRHAPSAIALERMRRRGPRRSPCACRPWWRSCRPRSW